MIRIASVAPESSIIDDRTHPMNHLLLFAPFVWVLPLLVAVFLLFVGCQAPINQLCIKIRAWYLRHRLNKGIVHRARRHKLDTSSSSSEEEDEDSDEDDQQRPHDGDERLTPTVFGCWLGNRLWVDERGRPIPMTRIERIKCTVPDVPFALGTPGIFSPGSKLAVGCHGVVKAFVPFEDHSSGLDNIAVDIDGTLVPLHLRSLLKSEAGTAALREHWLPLVRQEKAD